MKSEVPQQTDSSKAKNPNFGVVVASAAAFLLIALAFAIFFLHRDAKKVDPHGPSPTPNSMMVPLHPERMTVTG
ncbi:hypothetical protein [Granulicella tundricola]|uniref:hypothetical protein n=1 Tax=Granulicella tundricola TaxID=940615 RepID=UPI000306D281|nr:hypothetical protein [Granulicella tundricola]